MAKDKENEWWLKYVETNFHNGFMKQCKGKFSIKYKITIPGVPYGSIKKHMMIFDKMKYDNVKLNICENASKTRVYINSTRGTPDWFVNHLFNNGAEYTYTNASESVEYGHYHDTWQWTKTRNQSLIFTGKLKTRVNNGPWIKHN